MLRKLCFKTILHQEMYQSARKLKTVYRYMDDKKNLESFLEGKIRISTLGACRAYENQEKGDCDEGKEVYRVSQMTDEDPNFHKKANKLGMSFEACYGTTITNCRSETYLPNGFVLCATARRDDEKFSKDFGEFCLKINDGERFFQLVSRAIREKYDLLGGHHEKVIYNPQYYEDDELPPGKIGFVKRPKYEWQEEYRFLWLPKDLNIEKFLMVDVPDIKHLCEHVL